MPWPQKFHYFRTVVSLSAGEAQNLDCRDMNTITVIAGTGATVTWSRIDTIDASSHGTGGHAITAPTAGNAVSQDVDWPFYRVSTAGGPATIAVV